MRSQGSLFTHAWNIRSLGMARRQSTTSNPSLQLFSKSPSFIEQDKKKTKQNKEAVKSNKNVDILTYVDRHVVMTIFTLIKVVTRSLWLRDKLFKCSKLNCRLPPPQEFSSLLFFHQPLVHCDARWVLRDKRVIVRGENVHCLSCFTHACENQAAAAARLKRASPGEFGYCC